MPRSAPTRGRRRATSPASSRERLLAAALEVFAERGFDGARTRDIAARAKVNLGLLQYHFGGKEKLWRAAVTHTFAALEAALVATDATALATAAGLEGLLRTCVRFVAANPEFVRLMNDECRRETPRMRWLVDHHGRRLYEATTALLAGASRRGLLPDLPAPSAYYILIGAVGMLFSQAAECRRLTGEDPAAFADAHAEALIRLLLRPGPAAGE